MNQILRLISRIDRLIPICDKAGDQEFIVHSF
jgi:hypothetical protein